MRVAIVGAGAIGCYLGARLGEAGHEVTLVARPAQAAAINEGGLLVRALDGTVTHHALRAVPALDAAARPELLLLTVKTQDVVAACEALPPEASGAPVVTLQNGLQADELAAGVLGRERVVGGVVMCAVSYLRPGEIEVQFPGWVIVGEPFGPLGERARTIQKMLQGAGVSAFATRNLPGARWSKLISNLNNGICAATGLALPEVARSPLGRRLSVRVMREGVAVAKAEGVRLDHALYGLAPGTLRRDPRAALVALLQGTMTTLLGALPERAAARVVGLAAKTGLGRIPLRGSTWQSIARGRPSEIAYLNGEVVRRGRARNVPTPYNEHLVRIVGEVERTGAFVALEALEPPGAEVVSAAQQACKKAGGAS